MRLEIEDRYKDKMIISYNKRGVSIEVLQEDDGQEYYAEVLIDKRKVVKEIIEFLKDSLGKWELG